MGINTVGPNRVAVVSSNLESVGYNSDGRVLEVKFKTGRLYRYFAVPADVYNGLLAADSKGEYFYQHVALGGFSYEQVPGH